MINIWTDLKNDTQFITRNPNQLLDYMYKHELSTADIKFLWDNGERSNEAILN